MEGNQLNNTCQGTEAVARETGCSDVTGEEKSLQKGCTQEAPQVEGVEEANMKGVEEIREEVMVWGNKDESANGCSAQLQHEKRKKRVLIDDSEEEDDGREVGPEHSISAGDPEEEALDLSDEVEAGLEEEDELLSFIKSRTNLDEKELGKLRGGDAEDSVQDDSESEIIENIVEDDLEEEDSKPEMVPVDTGDKLGGDWIPEVKPIASLMEKIRQKHQQTVLRAKEVLKRREKRKQEEIRMQFEEINDAIAEEEAGFDSEEECHQIEIIPGGLEVEYKSFDNKNSVNSHVSEDSDGEYEDSDGQPDGSNQEIAADVVMLDDDNQEGSDSENSGHNDGSESCSDQHLEDEVATLGSPLAPELPQMHNDDCSAEQEDCDASIDNDSPIKSLNVHMTNTTAPADALEQEDGDQVMLDSGSGKLCDEDLDQPLEDLYDDVNLSNANASFEEQNKQPVRKRLFRLTHESTKALLNEQPVPQPKASFVEFEAEMSDDGGHTDDEDGDEIDEELAEFLACEEAAAVADNNEEEHIEAHKHWGLRQDEMELNAVVKGVEQGWGRKRQRAGHAALEDEDNGTLEDAKRRRIAQNESDSGSDEDEYGAPGHHHVGRNGVEQSDDFSIGSLDDMSQSGDERDDATMGVGCQENTHDEGHVLKKEARKDTKTLAEVMKDLVAPNMLDMLKGAETNPMKAQNLPSYTQDGQEGEQHSIIPLGKRRQRRHDAINDGPSIMDGFLAIQGSSSTWETDEGSMSHAQGSNKLVLGEQHHKKHEEKSILMTALEGGSNC